MQIDEKSTKFKLFNQINNNSNNSFYLLAKFKLNEYLKKRGGSDKNIKKLIDLIIEPDRLLSTELNDRVNFFNNPIIGHELILPISNRIDKFSELGKEFNENKEVKEIIDDLVKGYSNSIQQYINDAIANKDSNNKMNIYQRKINLSTEDLEFRNVDLTFAYEMASYDPIHEFDYVKHNKSGNSFGRVLGNVYYKVDNGTRLLRPAKEDANYKFYCGLFGIDQQLISPTQLLILSKIPILPSNLTESPERKQINDIKKAQSFKTNKQVFEFDPELKEKVKAAMKLERSISIQSSLFRKGISFQSFLEDLESKENSDQILESSIDLNSFSSHVLASLLLIPTDYKPDNLILDTETKQIVGIDNDQCLEFDEFETVGSDNYLSIKNILYTLSTLMNKPVDIKVVKQFTSQVPELIILNWLFQIYEKEKIFNKMIDNSLLSTFIDVQTVDEATQIANQQKSKSNINDGLGLPLLFPKGWINSLLNRFSKIKRMLLENQLTTHQQLFKEVHPFASTYYESLSVYYPHPIDQIDTIYNKYKEFQRLISINAPSETYFKELSESTFIKPDRIVSIKDSIIDFIVGLNISNFHKQTSSNSVFIEFIKFVIKIKGSNEFSFDGHSFNISWYSTIQTSILLLIGLGARVDLIQELIKLLAIEVSQLDKDENNNSKSIIHLLLSQDYDTTIKKNGILILKSIGINIDIIENGLAPLEFIVNSSNNIETSSIELFKFLIGLGSGKSSKDSNINKFYQSLTLEQKRGIKESIVKLSNINPKVGWILALNHLFPLIKSSVSYDKNKLLLTTTRGKRIIKDDQWNQIFDSDNKPIKSNQYGRRSVPFIQDEECGHRIYLKFEPQFPGIELAVSTLGQQLFGYFSPYSELAMINGIPVLLVQEIKGTTLNDFIEKDPSKLSLLDASNISKLLVFEMLINNADGNFGNYIINQDQEDGGKLKMYSIDNDQSFMPPVAKELNTGLFSKNKLSLQVETCLFLLDQMNDKVHQDVIQCLKDKDLVFIIKKWLDSLNSHHQQWIEFFKINQIKNTGTNEIKTITGVSFVPNQIKLLFSKVVRLINLLRKPITHFQLLLSLEPLVANRYKSIFNLFPDKNSIYKRFNYLKNPYNNNNNQILTSSMYSSVQILESRDIPTIESIQRDILSGKYSPDNALAELKEIQSQHTSIQQIIKDLTGNGSNGKGIDLQKLTSINNLTDSIFEEFLKKSDLSKLTQAQEAQIFKLIKSKELINLYIRNSSIKTSTLNSFNFKSLSILNLSNCKSLQTFTSSGYIIKGPIQTPCLKKLKLDNCIGLIEVLLVANNLEYFSASNCKSLGTVFNLDSPNIKYLNLSNGSLSNISNLLYLQTFTNLSILDISNNKFCVKSSEKSVRLNTKKLIQNNLENFPNLSGLPSKPRNVIAIGYFSKNYYLIDKVIGHNAKSFFIHGQRSGTNMIETMFDGDRCVLYNDQIYRFHYISELNSNGRIWSVPVYKQINTIILFFDPANEKSCFRIISDFYKTLKSKHPDIQFKFILFGVTETYKEDFPTVRNFYNESNGIYGDIKLIYSIGVDNKEKELKVQKELYEYLEQYCFNDYGYD